MNLRTLAAILLALLPFAGNPVCAQDDEVIDDPAMREEAHKTVMIRHSKTARTTSLLKIASGPELINLWFDFCRNRYGGRSKPSSEFGGTPHIQWLRSLNDKKQATLTLRVAFAVLRIDEEKLEVFDAPSILQACIGGEPCYGRDFSAAVKVDGDDEKLLRVWTVMLITSLVENAEAAVKSGAKEPNSKEWTAAKKAAYEFVKADWTKSSPTRAEWPDAGTLDAGRTELLNAIGVLGAGDNGPLLRKILGEALKQGSVADIREAKRVLAQSNSKEGAEFVLASLNSKDVADIQAVIYLVRPDCDAKVLARVVELLKEGSDDSLTMGAINLLESAIREKTLNAQSARKELLAYFTGCEDTARHKYTAACALARARVHDAAVVTYLNELLESLDEGDGRRGYIKTLLDDLANNREK